MATVMPTRTDSPHYVFTTTLEGTVFQLDFDWNDRDAAWIMSISAADGTPLLMGRKVVLDSPLTGRFRDPRLPAGEFFAVDTSGTGLEAGLNELGTRVQLLYFDSSELTS